MIGEVQGLVVRDAERSQTMSAHPIVASFVEFDTFVVDRAIHLDDQSRLMAVEVGDERADHVLSSELESQTAPAHQIPKRPFGVGRLPAHLTSARHQVRRGTAAGG